MEFGALLRHLPGKRPCLHNSSQRAKAAGAAVDTEGLEVEDRVTGSSVAPSARVLLGSFRGLLARGDGRKARALRGSVWLLSGTAASNLVRLISNVILTRLLFPEAFGLMSLVTTFTQGLTMFSDIGIRPNIVQHPDGEKEEFLNTAWTIQVLRGGALWITAAIGAWPFAAAYGDERLVALISVAAFSAVLTGFNSTSLATASRRMDVRSITLVEFASHLSGAVVMILLAVLSKSVWSIVVGSLVGALVKLLLSHLWLAEFRNRLAWDGPSAQALFSFGRWVFLSTLVTFAVQQSDRLLFGQLVGIATLGIYAIACNFSALPQQVVGNIVRSIAFPLYSQQWRAQASLAGVYDRVRMPIICAAGLLVCVLCVVSRPLISILYDPRYLGAAWMLRLLCVGSWFQVLECNNANAVLAMGQSRLVAVGGSIKMLAMLILIPLGYRIYGFPGAIAGFAGAEIPRYLFSLWAVARAGVSVWRKDLLLSLVAVATVLSGSAAVASFDSGRLGSAAALAAGALCVVVPWLALLLVLLRSGNSTLT